MKWLDRVGLFFINIPEPTIPQVKYSLVAWHQPCLAGKVFDRPGATLPSLQTIIAGNVPASYLWVDSIKQHL